MQINSFLGERSVIGSRSIPDNAVSVAKDIYLDDAGVFIQRPGYALSKIIPVSASYTTQERETYIISDGILYHAVEGLVLVEIGACSATEFCDFSKYLFTNDGKQVFADTMVDINLPAPTFAPEIIGTVDGDNYVAAYTWINGDGLESALSPAIGFKSDGAHIVIPHSRPGCTVRVYSTSAGGEVFYDVDGKPLLPELMAANAGFTGGGKVEIFDSRLFSTEQFKGHTVVWYSQRYHWHLFDKANDYFVIPGQVEAISATDSALFIGTDSAMYAYDGNNLTKLANYGVVPGRSVAKQTGSQGQQANTLLINTKKGICKAFPFEPLTEKRVAPKKISHCASTIVKTDGVDQFIVLHD
jgi:hypothetical protein